MTPQSNLDPQQKQASDDGGGISAHARTRQEIATLSAPDQPASRADRAQSSEAVDMSEVSIVGLIMNASETMLDAFVQLQRYGRLALEIQRVSADERFQLARRDDQLWMVDTRANPNDFPELTDGSFAGLVCGPRRFCRNRMSSKSM